MHITLGITAVTHCLSCISRYLCSLL